MTIAHITLATRDVVGSRHFFEAVFGWKCITPPDNIPTDAAWLEIDGGQQLHLLRVDDFCHSPFEAEFGRHVALYRQRDEFDDLKTRLVEQGAEIIAPMRQTDFERFFFRDPNGYAFEVMENRAST